MFYNEYNKGKGGRLPYIPLRLLPIVMIILGGI